MESLRKLSLFLTFLAVSLIAFSQTVPVSGKITDATGKGIPGINVIVKGSTKGTATKADGSFSIDAPSNATLVVTGVGFTSQEVDLNGRTSLTISLVENQNELASVVVTALGISKDSRKVGYSVTTVGGDQFSKARETNVALSLQGQVAGLNVKGTNGGPGGSALLLLRGMPSITSNGSPLFVVNGVPIDNTQRGSTNEWGGSDNGDGIGNLNPDDIESMTVLKGQAASALYGSKATNGVILITTKTGKKGSFSVEYNGNYMVDKAIDNTDFQYVYGQGQNGLKPGNVADAQASGRLSWGSKLDGSSTIQYDGNSYAYSAYKDNVKNFYRAGPSFTNTVSVSSGSDRGNFRLSASNLDNQSIVRNSGLTRRTVNLNLEQKITDKFKVSFLGNYIDQQYSNRLSLSDGPLNPTNGFFLANNINENILKPGYDTLTGHEVQFSDDNYVTNPWFVVNRGVNNLGRKRLISAVTAKYNFTDWLYIQGRTGYDLENDRVFSVTPYGTAYSTNFAGGLNELSQQTTSQLNVEGILGATKYITSDIQVNALVGGNTQALESEKTGVSGGPFVLPYLYSYTNVVSFGRIYSYARSKINSAYYSADFNYRNFLSLTTTGRFDAYSTLPTNNNKVFTPSVSGSFIFSELTHIPKLSYGKIRAAYANTSGQPPSAYNTSVYYGVGNALNGVPTGNFSSNLPNGLLKPFTLTETEVGAELKFFGSRLGVDVTYFNRKSHNEILGAQYSPSTGYTSGFVPSGSVQNKGVEVLVTGNPIQNPTGFNWNISFNLTSVHNKILQTDVPGNNINQGTDRPNHGVAITSFVKGLAGPQIIAPDYKYDSKGNIVVDASGLPEQGKNINLGSVLPTLYGGLTNEFSYKALSFSFLLAYNYGNKILSATKDNAIYRGLDKSTLVGRDNGLTVGVREDGSVNTTVATAQAYYQAVALNVPSVSVLNGDFIKLRQVSLGYTISEKVFGKVPVIKSVQVSLVGRNLLTLLKHSDNIDPEATFGAGVNYAGIEGGNLPSARTFGINANIKFK